jgi:DNA polymerase III delta prime subunit
MNAWSVGEFNGIKDAVTFIFRKGYSGLQILEQINNEITSGNRIEVSRRANIGVAMARTEKKIVDGADEELQILSLLTAC